MRSYSLIKGAKILLSQEKGFQPSSKPSLPGLKICLAYPNSYFLGMSNLGFQLIYGILSQRPNLICERVFLPSKDEEEEYRRTKSLLFSLESQIPIRDFEIIAFSLSFELDYLNILKILKLGKIPLFSQGRGEDDPLIIAGGACTFLNPEPVSPFFDFLVVGEGEEVVLEVVELVGRGKGQGARGKRELLKELSDIPGVYVPSLYEVTYKKDGTIKEVKADKGAPMRIKKRWVKKMSSFPFIVTPQTSFKNTYLVELSRGCPFSCRFCMVRSCYAPYRVRKKEEIISLINEGLRYTDTIGLLGAAVSSYPRLEEIISYLNEKLARVKISSLYLGTLGEGIVSSLKEGGQRTLTLGLEVGTDKMGRVINKKIDKKAIDLIAKYNFRQLKLYFMIGLPAEEEEDLRAIALLVQGILATLNSQTKVVVNITPFIPKPSTPFQWVGMEDIKVIAGKLRFLRDSLRRDKRVKLNLESSRWALIEAALSRGDRRVSEVIVKAEEKGGNFKDWRDAFEETNLTPSFYANRKRERDEIFPWQSIEGGVNRERLWEEYQEGLKIKD